MNKDLLDKMMEELIDGPSEYEIADEQRVHVLDNGATMQIADSEPVYPDEMGDSYEPNPGSGGGEAEVLGATEQIRGGRVSEIFRDDWVDELRIKAKSYIGPQGQLLDEFDAKYQEQGLGKRELIAEAPFVRTNAPPSVVKAQLGGQALCTPGNAPISVARWDADHQAEAYPLTVTVAPVGLLVDASPQGSSPSHPDAPTIISPYAVIQYGTKGFSALLEVDIGQGRQFTLSGSFIDIAVAMDPVQSGGSSANQMNLTAMLSFQPCVRSSPLQRTRYAYVADGGNQIVRVPPYAVNVYVQRDLNARSYTVAGLDNAGNARWFYLVAANAQLTQAIPLGSDIIFISLTDGAEGGGSNFFSLIFELAA